MRILMVNDYYKLQGGDDIYFDLLVELLKSRNHDIYVYEKNNKSIEENLQSKYKSIVNMFSIKDLEKEFVEIIKTFKPDIAHINNIFPLISPSIYNILKAFRIPMVQSINTFKYICPKGTLYRDGKFCNLCVGKSFYYPSIVYNCYHNSKLASLLFNASFIYHKTLQKIQLVDKFIFLSKFAQEYHVKSLHLPEYKTAVLHPFAKSIKKPDKKYNRRKKYFIFVGRLSEEKGILSLVKLFTSLPQLNLMIIGDGPMKKNLLKFNKYSNIEIKNYIPHYKLNELYNYIQQAISMIIPSASHFEFGPYVLIESFACGTPVIVPRAGVFLERVNSKTGIFYEAGNFKDLKLKIMNAATSKDRLRLLSNNARKEYETKYTPNLYYRSLMELYCNLV